MAFEADPGQAAPNYDALGAVVGTAAGYVERGGLNQAAIAQASAETQKLVAAAKSGGFKITADGVKPLREALANMSEELSALRFRTTALDDAPQLGDHSYAKTVAAHDHKGATQAANSANAVIEQFKQVVRDADEALARAAGLYKDVEDRAADAMKKIQA